MKTQNSPNRIPHAFTLIELMIVIFIIGVLAAIILPVLANAQAKARMSACLNIQRQFAFGFQMFSSDNQEGIMGMSDTDRDRDWRIRPTSALNPELAACARVNNAQDANIVADQYGYKIGQMYPYAKNTDMVHCPGDSRYRLPQHFAYASFSGNGAFLKEAARGGAKKTSDLKRPSERFLWIEENDPRKETVNFGGLPYTIGENKGPWDLNDNAAWWDAPAVFHRSSGTLSFADGHAENRRWVDECTRAIAGYVNDEKPVQAQKITLSGDTALGSIGCGSSGGSPRDLPWLKLRYDGRLVNPANPIDW